MNKVKKIDIASLIFSVFIMLWFGHNAYQMNAWAGFYGFAAGLNFIVVLAAGTRFYKSYKEKAALS